MRKIVRRCKLAAILLMGLLLCLSCNIFSFALPHPAIQQFFTAVAEYFNSHATLFFCFLLGLFALWGFLSWIGRRDKENDLSGELSRLSGKHKSEFDGLKEKAERIDRCLRDDAQKVAIAKAETPHKIKLAQSETLRTLDNARTILKNQEQTTCLTNKRLYQVLQKTELPLDLELQKLMELCADLKYQ